MGVKADGKSYKFLSSRTHKAHMLKRTRRAQKFQRAVVGATLQDIMATRNQKRGAKSPEGAGSPRRQGSEESHRQEACCQGQGCAEGTEGNKERPEGWPRQGWRQEINILPIKSCGNLFNK